MEAPAELQGLLWPGIPRVLLHKQGGPRGHHRGEHRVVVVHLQGALECTHREPPEIVGQVEVRCQAADRLDVPHLLRRAGATRSGRMLPAFDVEVGNDASTVVSDRLALALQETAPGCRRMSARSVCWCKSRRQTSADRAIIRRTVRGIIPRILGINDDHGQQMLTLESPSGRGALFGAFCHDRGRGQPGDRRPPRPAAVQVRN